MTKYEYKTVTLGQKGQGWRGSRTIPELESTLNREGAEGWRLCEITVPPTVYGESNHAIVIFERALEQTED